MSADRAHHWPRPVAQAAAWSLAALAVVAGVGVLYLLRSAGALASGPPVRDALPLEELARADAQPLARMLAAWLPAGLVMGGVLAALTRMRPAACALGAALLGAALLALTGAASDAVENSERLLPELGPQLSRPGLLVGSALLLAGAYIGAFVGAAVGEGGAARRPPGRRAQGR